MKYPSAYIEYLAHFHGSRDYFECHEVLEEHWKTVNPPRQRHWVGLIQIAVGLYHHRIGNMSGATRMIKSARRIITANQSQISNLGLDYVELINRLEHRQTDIAQGVPYESMSLPIIDEELLRECENRCNKMGFIWGSSSNLNDRVIVEKHRLRDRSSIIEIRRESLKQKHSDEKRRLE